MNLEARDVVLILGMRGCGKSTHAKKIVTEHRGRVLAFDPHDEYGLRRVELGEESPREPGDDTLTALELAQRLDDDALRVAVVPSWRSADQKTDPMAQVSDSFVEFVRVVQTSENALIAIDELGMLQGKAQSAVSWLATQSRHWGMPLILVAQRAVQIPPTAREQATVIISYRQKRPEDIDALRERIGDRADRLPDLPPFECIEWREADELKKIDTRETGDKKP